MVEIIIKNTGDKLDLLDGKITYTKQVNDIANFSLVNDSFSRSEKMPRTKHNELILGLLGIIGDNSRKPYEKIKIKVLDNGVAIVEDGNLIITESTKNEYKYHVKDGAIDFYSEISDDTIEELDLSRLNHIKSPSIVRGTFNNFFEDYKYFVAWYGLPLLPEIDNVTNLPLRGMVPFIRFGKIIEAIEEKYNWTFEGLPDEVTNKYLSTRVDDIDELELRVGDFDVQGKEDASPGWNDIKLDTNQIDNNFISYSPNYIIVQDAGTYHFQTGANLYYNEGELETIPQQISSRISVNNQDYINVSGAYTFELELNSGDIIRLQGRAPLGASGNGNITSQSGYLKVVRLGTELVNFSNLLSELKIKDFIKEVLNQIAGTPFFDTENRIIEIKTITQRISAESQDLSNFVVERGSEKYKLGNFAKQNFFRLKYDEDEASYRDGFFRVNNENLENETDVYKSFSYAPERNRAIFNGEPPGELEYTVPYLKAFEIENAEDEGEIKYKPLKDRYFIVDFEPTENRIYIQGEYAVNANIAIPIDYQDVANRWEKGNKIFNNTRVLSDYIFHMHLNDFVKINLKKTVYLEQESAYFLISKLTIDKKKVKAELIKINNYGEHRLSSFQPRQLTAN